jgi:hypothetical protein
VSALVHHARLIPPYDLPHGVAVRARGGPAQAVDTGSPAVIWAARDAYLHGLHAVGRSAAVFAATLAVLGRVFVHRPPRRTGEPPPEPGNSTVPVGRTPPGG